jgi:ribosome-associated translation inhibitor RaiA
MQIQVSTDNHVVGSAELTRQVEAVMENALSHLGDRVTRVEVYLSDENSSQKSAENDKRCVMEARLAGLQPIVVSQQGPLLDQAIDGAAAKLEKTLKRTLGRLDN